MAKKKSLFQEFTKGILVENPVLRLVLGTCPTLAISTSVTAAFGMGIAATVVLILSNMAISALRKCLLGCPQTRWTSGHRDQKKHCLRRRP